MDLIKALNNEQLKENVPVINVGDTVRVSNKIKEGTRERVQLFEGTVIAKNSGGISRPSPSDAFPRRRRRRPSRYILDVEKVEIVRNGKVRRAKLYYLRDRVGKSSKVKEQL
ncbi:MAG: 50S ribosomal protein L19 [Eubacteriales bacterium]